MKVFDVDDFDIVVCRMGARKAWSFDDAITTKYACRVMAYDPTYVMVILASHFVITNSLLTAASTGAAGTGFVKQRVQSQR